MSFGEEVERDGALESKTPERWRVALAVLVALIALPVLLLDYQSGANATDDSVTLSLDESGELDSDIEPLAATTSTTSTSSTIAVDAAQSTDAQTTVPDTSAPTTVAPTTAAPTSTSAPTSTAAPSTTEPAPSSTAPPATEPPNTQPPETTPPTTVPAGTQPPDTVPPDTTPPTTTPPDTVPPDTAPPETTVPVVGPVTPVPAEAGDPTAEQWWSLRQCESTNNYGAVSATGKFRGAYQFSQATWNWVADNFHPELSGVDPAAAIPANQDAMALALTRMQSPGNAWPKCSRTAGIA